MGVGLNNIIGGDLLERVNWQLHRSWHDVETCISISFGG